MDNNKFVKYLIIVLLVIFIILTIHSFGTGNLEYIGDKILAVVALLVILWCYKSFHMNIPLALFAAFVFILHHLKLYGNFYLGIPFDRWIHFLGVMAVALLAFQFLKYHNKMKSLNLWDVCVFSFLTALGIASLIEVTEFIGYSFLGEGEGLLLYGTGDYGEWNNSSWDLICNTIGAFVAVTAMGLKELIWPKKKRK